MKNQIKLSKERKAEMVSEIQAYFSKERDEEIGELASALLLDFIVEKLAPAFYNQGVWDSYQYLNERIEDLLGIQK